MPHLVLAFLGLLAPRPLPLKGPVTGVRLLATSVVLQGVLGIASAGAHLSRCRPSNALAPGRATASVLSLEVCCPVTT